jgi:hypothetical protein
MIGLATFLLRAVLLAGFTFGFVVLYEHGPQGFTAGAPVEWKNLENFVVSVAKRTPPEPASAPAAPPAAPAPAVASEPPPTPPPTPTPTPKPKNPPSAWEKLQSTPIGEGMDLPIGGSN